MRLLVPVMLVLLLPASVWAAGMPQDMMPGGISASRPAGTPHSLMRPHTGEAQGITVIGGRNFYSLGRVRKFYGHSKPMPVPVNKYMREPYRSQKQIVRPETQKSDVGKTDSIIKNAIASPISPVVPHPPVMPQAPAVAPVSQAAAVVNAARAPSSTPVKPGSPAADVLSLFEPEGQASASPATR